MMANKPNIIHDKLNLIKNSEDIGNKKQKIFLETESSSLNIFLEIYLFQ